VNCSLKQDMHNSKENYNFLTKFIFRQNSVINKQNTKYILCPDTQIKSKKNVTQTGTSKTLKYKSNSHVIHISSVRAYGGFFSSSQNIVSCVITSEQSIDHI